MATKKKVMLIIAVIVSLIVFILEYSGSFEFLSNKLLLTYDFMGEDKLIFVDVDYGNCAIVQSGNKTAIINFGGIKDGGNSLVKAIRKYRITKVDYAIITVCNENHLGGFMALCDLVDIDKVIIPNIEDFTKENNITSLTVKDKILNDCSYELVEPFKPYMLGNFALAPVYYNAKALNSAGNAVLYKISLNNHSAIIGGSFHKDITYNLLSSDLNLKADIFLLPGFSDNSNWNLPFITTLNAKYLVSSSSFKNDAEIQLDFEFLKQKHKIYRTDVNGDITFYFNKDELKVFSER